MTNYERTKGTILHLQAHSN